MKKNFLINRSGQQKRINLNMKLKVRKYDELEQMLKKIHEIMNGYPEARCNIEVEFCGKC